MRIEKIELQNIGGLERLEVRPGKLTKLRGANATGKSSFIRAILAALRGGSTDGILRHGQSRGHVTIELSDGGRIRRGFTAKGSNLAAKVGDEAANQTRLDQLAVSESIDPIAFLNMAPKDRVEVLLRICPIAMDHESLLLIYREAYGSNAESKLKELGDIGDAIGRLDADHGEFYERHRELNTSAKEARSSAAAIHGAVPEGSAAAILTAYEAKKAEQNRRTEEHIRKVEAIGTTKAEVLKDVEYWESEAIEKIRAEAAKRRVKIHTDADQAVGKTQQEGEALAALREEVARLKEKHEGFKRAAVAVEKLAEIEGRASELEQGSERLTAALKGVAELRSNLLKELPIPGMEILDGSIVVEDVAFDDLNEARRIMIALELAVLSAGELGLVVVDGIERLDHANQEKLYAAIRGMETDLAFIVTEVSDDPTLQVETE